MIPTYLQYAAVNLRDRSTILFFNFIVTRENSRIVRIFFLTNFTIPLICSTRKEKRELKYLTTVIPYNAERGCPALPTLQERP